MAIAVQWLRIVSQLQLVMLVDRFAISLVSYLGSFARLAFFWAIRAVSILCPGGPDNARDFHMEMISLFS